MTAPAEGDGMGQLEQGLRDILEAALPESDSWFAIHARIRAAVPAGDEERYRALVWAFGYDLVGPAEEERREREGSPFGAMIELADGRMPPRLADVPEEDVGVWGAAHEAIDDPRLRSRLGDLLWSRRAGNRPDVAARSAAQALIELSGDPVWELVEKTEGLSRALEIARELSDEELTETVVTRTVRAITEELEISDERPGIAFTLLRALVDLPKRLRPTELGELLERAEARYQEDPFQLETVIDLRAQLADAEEEVELRRRQVDVWRERAARVDGILRLSSLQRALEIARTHGLRDQAKEVRVEIGGIDEGELDLKEVSAEVKVPREEVEKFIEAFLGDDDWRLTLRRLGSYGPPGGEDEEFDERVEKLMKEYPLQYLVTKLIIDADTGVPIFEATDPIGHKRAARAEQRILAMRLWAHLAAEILARLGRHPGRPSAKELTEFLTTDLIDEEDARVIARGMEIWWEGRPNESAHLIAPRLEAVIRAMARRLGLAIVREPEGEKPGRVLSLRPLMHALRGRLGTPGWHSYFYALLCDPLALNLRNVIAHGLRDAIAADDAALLIHAACFLTTLEASESPS